MNNLLAYLKEWLKEFWDWLRLGCRDLKRGLHRFKVHSLRRFTHWIDPRLQKYRTDKFAQHAPVSPKHTPIKIHENTEVDSESKNLTSTPDQFTPEPNQFTPNSAEEFLNLLRRTPRSVLSSRERHVIATIMNFPTVKVSEIMLPKSVITYVHTDEILGPLTLDRLYRSGFQHFPVLDANRKIIGVVHTTSFNNLEIKETRRVADILDPKICYVREDYTLNQALAAFLRTNSYFFLVIDHSERIVGILTYEMLVDYLLGETPEDNFEQDSNRLAVANRKN